MVSKRAQNRQTQKIQRAWQNQKTSLTSLNQQTSNLQQSLPDSQKSYRENLLQDLEQRDDWQNLSQQEQMELLAAMEAMEQSQQPNLSQLPQTTKRKYQRKATGSGENGLDDAALGSELIAPLTGKHLKQEKELKSLAGAVVFGLVAAAKASNSATLAADAGTVAKYGEEVAHAWAVLGRKYGWLYEVLDKLCAGSVIAVALAPLSAMLAEIAGNHGIAIPVIGKSDKAA